MTRLSIGLLSALMLAFATLACYGCRKSESIGGPDMESPAPSLLPPTDTTDTTHWADAPYEKILLYNEDSMIVVAFTPFGDTLGVDTVSIPSAGELAAKFDSVIARIKLDCDVVMLLSLKQERLKIELLRVIDSLEKRQPAQAGRSKR